MISLTDVGQGGVIDSLVITGNLSIIQRNPAGLSNSMPAANLTNSSVGLSSPFSGPIRHPTENEDRLLLLVRGQSISILCLRGGCARTGHAGGV